MNFFPIAESDFQLGGMNIDIHLTRVYFHSDDSHREKSWDLVTPETFSDTMLQDLVLQSAPIEKSPDPVRVSSLNVRPGNPSADPVHLQNRQHPVLQILTQYLCDTLRKRLIRRIFENHPIIVTQAEGNIGMGHRRCLDDGRATGNFSGVGLEKLSSRGNRGKKILHPNTGARTHRHRRGLFGLTMAADDPVSNIRVRSPGRYLDR